MLMIAQASVAIHCLFSTLYSVRRTFLVGLLSEDS